MKPTGWNFEGERLVELWIVVAGANLGAVLRLACGQQHETHLRVLCAAALLGRDLTSLVHRHQHASDLT